MLYVFYIDIAKADLNVALLYLLQMFIWMLRVFIWMLQVFNLDIAPSIKNLNVPFNMK